MKNFFTIALLSVTGLAHGIAEEAIPLEREFISSTGKKIVAKFLGRDGNEAVLSKDNQIYRIDVLGLSEADQNFVEKWDEPDPKVSIKLDYKRKKFTKKYTSSIFSPLIQGDLPKTGNRDIDRRNEKEARRREKEREKRSRTPRYKSWESAQLFIGIPNESAFITTNLTVKALILMELENGESYQLARELKSPIVIDPDQTAYLMGNHHITIKETSPPVGKKVIKGVWVKVFHNNIQVEEAWRLENQEDLEKLSWENFEVSAAYETQLRSYETQLRYNRLMEEGLKSSSAEVEVNESFLELRRLSLKSFSEIMQRYK